MSIEDFVWVQNGKKLFGKKESPIRILIRSGRFVTFTGPLSLSRIWGRSVMWLDRNGYLK